MLQSGGELDLPLEPLGAQRHSQLGVEHLERDRPVVPEVLGEEDRRHPAATELALDRVAVSERLARPLKLTHPVSLLLSPFTLHPSPPTASGTVGSCGADRSGIDLEPAG